MFAFASLHQCIIRKSMWSEVEDEVMEYGPFVPREEILARTTAVRPAGGCRTAAVLDDLDCEADGPLTVAMSELLEEDIGFEIRDSELPFIEKGDREGELLGYHELPIAKGAQVEESEPLTCGEVVRLAVLLYGEEVSVEYHDNPEGTTSTDITGLLSSSPTVCQQMLAELVEELEELREEQVESIDCDGNKSLEAKDRTFIWKTVREEGKLVAKTVELSPLRQRMVAWLPQMEERGILRRLKACVQRGSVGHDWSYQDRWFFGEREGITHSQAEQNDEKFSKLAQFEDDDLHTQLEKARSTNLFKELYFQGGEELSAERRALDGTKRNRANKGENRFDAEYNRYLWRKSHTRGEEFKKALWKVLTAPLSAVKKHLVSDGEQLGVYRKKYNDSVKDAAPGPGRRCVQGKWMNTPLQGDQAVLALVRRGFKPSQLAKNVRFHKGAQWERIWIDSQQMKALEEAIAWRLANPEYQGLERMTTVGEKLAPATLGEYAELVLASAMRHFVGENSRRV